MTTQDAARIQAAAAKAGDGGVEKGSFPARAQVTRHFDWRLRLHCTALLRARTF